MKRTSTKSIVLILLVIFSLTLFGCGDSKPTTPPQASAATTTPKEEPQATPPTPPPQQETQTPAPAEKEQPTEHRYTGQGPNGEGIKGHIDKKKGTMIYHLPGDPYYSRTTHVSQWFFTEKEAKAAGYRPILR